MAYPLYRASHINLLLSMRHTAFLAFAYPIHGILYVFQSIHEWHLEPSLGICPLFANLVIIFVVLPG